MLLAFQSPFCYIILIGALAGSLPAIRAKQISRRVVLRGCVFGTLTSFALLALEIVVTIARSGGLHPILLALLPIVFLQVCGLGGLGGALVAPMIVLIKQCRFRLRFGIRFLLAIVAALSTILAVIFRPFERREYYNNGHLMARYTLQRSLDGKLQFYGTQYIYYPNGNVCQEFECDSNLQPENISKGFHYNDRMPNYHCTIENARYFLPDGTRVSQEVYLDYGSAGESVFHAILLKDMGHDLVWCEGAKIWRRRQPSDAPGRIQP